MQGIPEMTFLARLVAGVTRIRSWDQRRIQIRAASQKERTRLLLVADETHLQVAISAACLEGMADELEQSTGIRSEDLRATFLIGANERHLAAVGGLREKLENFSPTLAGQALDAIKKADEALNYAMLLKACLSVSATPRSKDWFKTERMSLQQAGKQMRAFEVGLAKLMKRLR